MASQLATRCFGSSSTVIPSTPGLPLFCLTRFNAALALPRSTTRSIRWSFPEPPFPVVAVGASPLRWSLGASPLTLNGSSACAAFWCLALPRLMAGLLSLPFGPSSSAAVPASSRRVAIPAGALRTRTASADFSLRPHRRRPFRREARSPQVRLVMFPAQLPDLRRSPLVARASRKRDRSPWLATPRIRFLFVSSRFCSPLLSAPTSRSDRVHRHFALRFARGRCDQLPPGFSPVHHLHAGHTRSRFAAAGS